MYNTRMKRIISTLLVIIFVLSAVSCSRTADNSATSESAATDVTTLASITELTAEPTESTTETTKDNKGHFKFNPKVCSPIMTEIMGEKMRDAWFSLIDAVYAGETTFECADDDTYNWMMGQFPHLCLPVIEDLITACDDRNHPVKNGVAEFKYNLPPEEVRQKIDEFGEMVEGILNDNLRDDYDDVEKALALYEYFHKTCEYDYDAADELTRHDVDYLTAMRVFNEHKGICCELATAYSFLLTEAGVDATTMSGNRSYDSAGHEWSYVRTGGKCYHIDPTYAICYKDSLKLAYFMMDDDKREEEDSYDRSSFYMTCCYATEYDRPCYPADDKKYEYLWDKTFVSADHESRKMVCTGINEDGYETECEVEY